jgi:hypothetical protein
MAKQDTQTTKEYLTDIYGTSKKGKETGEYVISEIQAINDALELREKDSVIFNGVTYSKGYEYNQKKGINYAPPKSSDDSEVSLGLVHEKIVSFVAIFLKYVFKKEIKCYDNNGQYIDGLGEIYELAIEFSQKMEKFVQKIALIYWETYTQGDAFVLEDWEVKTTTKSVAQKDGKELNPENMDFTYEFLEGLTYKEGEQVQTRRAVSRLLDGRNVILENPELDSGIQDQEAVTIEELLPMATAKSIYGSLKMWDKVPKTAEDIKNMVGESITLFDVKRMKDVNKYMLVHRRWNKRDNKFNIYLNGVAVLPMDTPFTIFYPRNNYPITQFSAERVSGSAYSRAIPAKTKFTSDYSDFVIKMLARKFEQDVDPALLVKGRYTLVKDIFDAGKRTHGVTKDMYEKADPDAQPLQPAHFSFLELLKDIQESQTVNPTVSGELSTNASATEIATVDQNQKDKLGYLLDGLVNGFMDMAMRRAETIESKYTIKQRETVVDGQKVDVYQNFTVNTGGIQNVVVFDNELQNDLYDVDGKRDELFTQAFNKRAEGKASEFFLVNPNALREGSYILDIDIKVERVKDSALQFVTMRDEFDWLLATFPNVNREEMQKEYQEISGRSDDMFLPQELMELQNAGGEEKAGMNMGSFGKPSIKGALRNEALGYER